MDLILKDNKIFDRDEQSARHLNAIEFFSFFKESQEDLGLKILGFGNLAFYISLQDEQILVKIRLKSEIGLIDMEHIDFSVDYFIFEDYWIPIELYELQNISLILKNLKIKLSQPINLGTAYELIAQANEFDIKYELDQQFIKYRPEISKNFINSMKLPLYPYQRFGVSWLTALHEQNIGGLLCDEMGLGKTAQILGLISQIKAESKPDVLIISPASLTINWKREFSKFLPLIEPYAHFGKDRTADRIKFSSQKIVITSYDLLLRDQFLFIDREWDIVICDEAQMLRNKNSQRHIAVQEIKSKCKILVTGTPVENSLKDIWSLSNIVKPGVLGSFSYFDSMIENSPSIARQVSTHIAPLILRREVKDVMKDLPELIEIDIPLEGTPEFNSFYEKIRTEALKKDSETTHLALLTKLRQICCYPKLIDSTYSDPQDSKIVRMLKILQDIKNNNNNEKVIIFSTYQKSLDLLSQIIKSQLGNPYVEIIDGRLPQEDRFMILDEFEKIENFAVLCINPSAGGVGLNITSANHVMHFNRQWNPALERQATARSYRRGQDKPVFVYKMYYLGTVEEIINERLQAKEFVAKETLSSAVAEGEEKDLKRAVAISPIFEGT